MICKKKPPRFGKAFYTFYVYHKAVHLPLRDVFLTVLCDDSCVHLCLQKYWRKRLVPKIFFEGISLTPMLSYKMFIVPLIKEWQYNWHKRYLWYR